MKSRSGPVASKVAVSPSTWWLGFKPGRYPKPIKLSEKVTVWRGSDLLDLVEGVNEQD